MKISEAISYGTREIEYFNTKLLLEKVFNCKENYLVILYLNLAQRLNQMV